MCDYTQKKALAVARDADMVVCVESVCVWQCLSACAVYAQRSRARFTCAADSSRAHPMVVAKMTLYVRVALIMCVQ